MKHIILCADDYGQTHAISQAIVELLKSRHLTATSCMVTSPDWPLNSRFLIPYIDQIDIGLHFNLTEGKPLSAFHQGFISLPHLLFRSHLRRLSKKAIRAELHAQLDQFIENMGVLPDFIDGHQHVHQFPIIRDALLEIYDERLREHGSYLRCIYTPTDLCNVKGVGYLKKLILQWSGAIAFKKELIARNIPHNLSFSGVYSFDKASRYDVLFAAFLNDIQEGGLIMCHPGLEDVTHEDAIRDSRSKEYAFIKSKQFVKLLDEHQVRLVRFKELY